MKAQIAGKPLMSTTDWLSKVCSLVFFVGCNFRCRYCFNTPLLEFNDQYQVDLERVYQELDLSRYLIDAVLATGGEPTLQPEPLQALAEWTHTHDLLFGIMTNGTKPLVIQQLIDAKLLDYVALDVKTVPDEKQYSEITQISKPILSSINKTVSILKKSKINYEFRTTLVPSLISDLNKIQRIIDWIGSEHYMLQVFRPTDTVLDRTLKDSFTSDQIEMLREFAKNNGIQARF
ncbi:MAG: anaerobic ribonucleoside-triphosphate reductase activating protein [Candidatus Thorarchaeota archaeon]